MAALPGRSAANANPSCFPGRVPRPSVATACNSAVRALVTEELADRNQVQPGMAGCIELRVGELADVGRGVGSRLFDRQRGAPDLAGRAGPPPSGARLTTPAPAVIRRCMTQVLTVRVSPDLVAKADARAAELGLDRGKYLRSLIEQDVSAAARGRRKRKFVSEDFIGSVPLGLGPYTNRRVRAILGEQAGKRREKAR